MCARGVLFAGLFAVGFAVGHVVSVVARVGEACRVANAPPGPGFSFALFVRMHARPLTMERGPGGIHVSSCDPPALRCVVLVRL